MSDEHRSPVAESANVVFAPDDDEIPIDASGEALRIDNSLHPRVCVTIGGPEAEITLTLAPEDAEDLQKELADAIDESKDALARWLEDGGIDRRR